VAFIKVFVATINLILYGGHPKDIQDLNNAYLPVMEQSAR
jgi:hypothetical protein